MTPAEQPDALRLAKGLRDGTLLLSERAEAAEWLERLHAENEALRERADFFTGMTREAQQFAQLYGDEVLTLRAAREADREAMRMALETLKEAKFVLDFATAAMLVPADADGPVVQIPAAIKALEQRVGES